MKQFSEHTYEELRSIIVDILLKNEKVLYEPDQYTHLTLGVAEILARRESRGEQRPPDPLHQIRLHPNDIELVRDIFWDLFRQGYITLGLDACNENWPFFRLSHFGEQTLKTQSPYRFHDTSSFIKMVTNEVPDVSSEALAYLDEAVAAFYADCILACCVMLGVAAEAEFLRLLDVAANSTTYGAAFAPIQKLPFIRQKIVKFQEQMQPLLKSKALPREAVEDLDTNFTMIQSVLRIARNEAGHPTFTKLNREQVYINLYLFIPFARQLRRLRLALA